LRDDAIDQQPDRRLDLGPQSEAADTIVAKLDATAYLSGTDTKDRNEPDMVAHSYAQQRTGQSMHSPKYLLPGAGDEQGWPSRLSF
jgi:hypothetical protein